MATKANHHFIPQLYLRGFANGTKRQAKVFVFDQNNKKSFTTLVRNVGSKRHFNRVIVEGMDPNALEDCYAEIEGHLAVHLRDVIRLKMFPSQDHFNSIMNLIANVSLRNPRLRGVLETYHKDIVEHVAHLTFTNKGIWEAQTKNMKADGYAINEDLTFEEMKEFHEKGEYELIIDQTHLIGLELEMLSPVINCLAKRNWCFVSAPLDSQFICSDDPVVLSWGNPEREKSFYSPGHCLPETLVFFPMCSNLMLIGSFELLPEETIYRDDQVIAANTHIAKYSANQIYARDGGFKVNLQNDEIALGSELHWRIP